MYLFLDVKFYHCPSCQLFLHFYRCFVWETLSPSELIPLIRVLFWNRKMLNFCQCRARGQRVSFLSSGTVKSMQLKTLTFCNCKYSLGFFCLLLEVCVCVWAKLRLKGFHFLFYSHQNCMQLSPFQECGGVLHHDCNSRLGWLMFARCAVQHRHRKNPTPSNGHIGYDEEVEGFLFFLSYFFI